MPRLPTKTTKKEEKEKLIFLSKQVCQKMDSLTKISGLIDTTVFKNFNEYIDKICNFTDQFKISEFANNISDISETVKGWSNISINYLPPSNHSYIKTDNYKDIKHLENEIDGLKKEIASYKSKENNFGIKITPTGNFIYKGKKLCVGTNSNTGKFLECCLKNENNFISDKYCFEVLKCEQVKNIKRDLNNKYLKKDGLRAIVNRSGDKTGYVLSKIIEIKSL